MTRSTSRQSSRTSWPTTVLWHDAFRPGWSIAEYRREQEQHELDANAKAVEILMRVKGLPERQAAQLMLAALRSAQAFQARGGVRLWGHRPATEEIQDLLARFPKLETPAAPRVAEKQPARPGRRGGIEGEPIPLDSKDPKYGEYLSQIRQRIQAHWVDPCGKDAPSGRCGRNATAPVIEFGTLGDGTVLVVTIRQRADDELYVEAAVRAIEAGSPLPAIPKSLLGSRTGLPVLATFRSVVDGAVSRLNLGD